MLVFSIKNISCLLIIICFVNCGDAQKSIDSIIEPCCHTIQQSQSDNIDSIQKLIFDKHISIFLQNTSTNKHDSLINAISLRLQKKCPSYHAIVLNAYDKGIWKIHDTKPTILASDEECLSLEKIGSFYYIEDIGKVRLEIKDGLWIEKFEDGSYSKLKFIKTNSCEFYLEFIESNNEMKMNFSKKGEKYYYQIIDKGENNFTLSVKIPESNQYFTSAIKFVQI